MAEWFKALVLKTRGPATVPGVRIPLLPPVGFGENCCGEVAEWLKALAC